jgi:hypothetical protein
MTESNGSSIDPGIICAHGSQVLVYQVLGGYLRRSLS